MSKLLLRDDETAHEILSAAIVPSICSDKPSAMLPIVSSTQFLGDQQS